MNETNSSANGPIFEYISPKDLKKYGIEVDFNGNDGVAVKGDFPDTTLEIIDKDDFEPNPNRKLLNLAFAEREDEPKKLKKKFDKNGGVKLKIYFNAEDEAYAKAKGKPISIGWFDEPNQTWVNFRTKENEENKKKYKWNVVYKNKGEYIGHVKLTIKDWDDPAIAHGR